MLKWADGKFEVRHLMIFAGLIYGCTLKQDIELAMSAAVYVGDKQTRY